MHIPCIEKELLYLIEATRLQSVDLQYLCHINSTQKYEFQGVEIAGACIGLQPEGLSVYPGLIVRTEVAAQLSGGYPGTGVERLQLYES
jgi:hypothetical protein